MHKSVEELKNTMSFVEYEEWKAYYNIEPFMADRLEAQLARIGYSNLFTGMSSPTVEHDYFLISHFDKKEKKESESPKDLENQIKAMFGVKD